MIIYIKILNWFMLALSVLATIGILGDPYNPNKGAGLFISALIFVQSISTLIYLEQKNGRN